MDFAQLTVVTSIVGEDGFLVEHEVGESWESAKRVIRFYRLTYGINAWVEAFVGEKWAGSYALHKGELHCWLS